MPPPANNPNVTGRSKLFGLLKRRERWGLSFKGKLVIATITLATGLLVFFYIYPFLAPTRRVDTRILVVEGWINPYAIRAAVAEFQAGHYEKIYTTGGPVVGNGGYINDFNTSASVGAESLVKYGVPKELVQMVPSRVSGRDRTYSSALVLRQYFAANELAGKNFNVLTEDVHARRTWLLFQEAFGKEVKVGIIAVPSPDYDAEHWWHYSEGVRDVLGESVAYLYARFFFWPSE